MDDNNDERNLTKLFHYNYIIYLYGVIAMYDAFYSALKKYI